MNTKTLFRVWRTENEWGRRGRVLAYFEDPVVADEYAVGRGWCGSKGTVESVTVVEHDGETFVLESTVPVKVGE